MPKNKILGFKILALAFTFLLCNASAQNQINPNTSEPSDTSDLIKWREGKLTSSCLFGTINEYEESKYELWKLDFNKFDSIIFEYDIKFYVENNLWNEKYAETVKKCLLISKDNTYLSHFAASVLNFGGKTSLANFMMELKNNEIKNLELIKAGGYLKYYKYKKDLTNYYNKAFSLANSNLGNDAKFLSEMASDIYLMTSDNNKLKTAAEWLEKSIKIEKDLKKIELMIEIQKELADTNKINFYSKVLDLQIIELDKEKRKFALNEKVDTINLKEYINQSLIVGKNDVLMIKYTSHPSLGYYSKYEMIENEYVILVKTEYDDSKYDSNNNGGDITIITKYYEAIKKGEAEFVIIEEEIRGEPYERACKIFVE